MDEYESLIISHSKWECKYHVVFIPKCRRKTLYGELKLVAHRSELWLHTLNQVFGKRLLADTMKQLRPNLRCRSC